MAGRGLGFLKQQQEAYGSQGDRIPKMWFKTGDVAKFWFGVFKDEDFLVPLMHIVKRQRRDGTLYTADVLCSRETRDDPRELCEVCVSGEGQGPFERLVAWTYVEAVAHPSKAAKGSDNWRQVKVGNSFVWLEECNELRLFIMKSRMQEQVEARFNESGTLADRRYKLEIIGEKQSRQEILIPDAPSEMPAEVRAAFENAMSLDDAMQQEFGTKKRPATTTAEGFGGSELPSADQPGQAPGEPEPGVLEW